VVFHSEVTAPFREEAVATREVAASNRDEVVQRILDDAHERDKQADARDSAANRRDMAASVQALLDEPAQALATHGGRLPWTVQPREQTEQHPERTDRSSPRMTPSHRSCERPQAQAQSQPSQTARRSGSIGAASGTARRGA
jgi:hypothetical protein